MLTIVGNSLIIRDNFKIDCHVILGMLGLTQEDAWHRDK